MKHSMTCNVRYGEVDRMDTVFCANYFIYHSEARLSYLKSIGIDYAALENEYSIGLPILETGCKYHKPLRFGDTFEIHTWVDYLSPKFINFKYEIYLHGELVNEGYSKAAFVHLKSRKIITCPDEIYKKFTLKK